MSSQGCCWPSRRLPAGGSCQRHRALTLPFCMAPAACPHGAIQASLIPLQWPLTRQAFSTAASGWAAPGCPTVCHQLLWLPSPCGAVGCLFLASQAVSSWGDLQPLHAGEMLSCPSWLRNLEMAHLWVWD